MRVAGGIEDMEDGWRGKICWGGEGRWGQRIMGRDIGEEVEMHFKCLLRTFLHLITSTTAEKFAPA